MNFNVPRKRTRKGLIQTIRKSSSYTILVMKLTVFLITIACMQVSAAVFSQKITISVKQVSLEKVLKQINKQTGYEVLYSSEVIRAGRPVNLNVKDQSLKDALDLVFREQPLGYEILEKTILIKEKPVSPVKEIQKRFDGVEVRGKIFDADSKQELVGATIEIRLLNLKAVTGLDGSFKFRNLPAGTHTITCSYIGYETITKNVSVTNETGAVTVNIAMSPTSQSFHEVVITGQVNKESDKSARIAEKLSSNVVNIVSAKSIQTSPDLTVANVLQRVSGVSVEKDGQGDGKYPIIRGMDKRYNYTLINGIKVASPDDMNRYLPMDIFPADLLERLEVTKSLTPDMEGDAIGGVMNMVMKSAPGKATIKANVATGYSQFFLDQDYRSFNKSAVQAKSPAERNGGDYVATYQDFSKNNYSYQQKKPSPDLFATLTMGNRFLKNKQLGVLVSGSLQNSYRGSNSTFFTLSPQPGLNNTPSFNEMQIRTYSTQQTRIGVNSKIDYVFNPKNDISLNYLLVKLDQYQNRNVVDTILFHRTGFGSGEVFLSDRSRVQKQTVHNAALRGRHQLTDDFGLNWTGSFSLAQNKLPDWGDLQSRHQVTTSADGTITKTNNFLDNFTRRWQHNSDKDYTGMLNFVYSPKELGLPLTLTTGGLYRSKERKNYLNIYGLTADLVNNQAQVFTNIDDAVFSFHPVAGGLGNTLNPNNYSSNEKIFSWYAQAKFEFRKLEALVGARMESTDQSYTTLMDKSFAGNAGKITYRDLLPGVHLKYKLQDNQNLRLSYFKSISRPGFFEIIPYNITNEYYTETGNPYLRHTEAQNIDFRYEFFPSGVDQILVGAFYKNLKNPIEQVLVVNKSSLELKPDNFGNATNYGAELVITKFFHYIGFSFNYTFTQSSITTDKRYYYRDGNDATGQVTTSTVQETRPLQGQSKHIGNLSFLYKNPILGLDMQLSAVYTGKRIQQLSPYAGLDYWLQASTNLDFSIEKKLNKNFIVYSRINNILNTPVRVFVNKAVPADSYIPAQSYADKILVQESLYKPVYQLGLRYNFN